MCTFIEAAFGAVTGALLVLLFLWAGGFVHFLRRAHEPDDYDEDYAYDYDEDFAYDHDEHRERGLHSTYGEFEDDTR